MPEVKQLFAQIATCCREPLQVFDYKRNEVLISAGQVEKYVYLIVSGAVRVVYRNGGEEFNIRFGYKDSVLTSLPSFFDASPSLFAIVALRKTRVQKLGRQDYINFISNSSSGQAVHLALLEDLVKQTIEREIDLLTTSPSQRYARVLKRSPQLFQHIPAYHIANYLRMTAETLSRLRKS
jgi:CRP-like cAMP-binding protein